MKAPNGWDTKDDKQDVSTASLYCNLAGVGDRDSVTPAAGSRCSHGVTLDIKARQFQRYTDTASRLPGWPGQNQDKTAPGGGSDL